MGSRRASTRDFGSVRHARLLAEFRPGSSVLRTRSCPARAPVLLERRGRPPETIPDLVSFPPFSFAHEPTCHLQHSACTSEVAGIGSPSWRVSPAQGTEERLPEGLSTSLIHCWASTRRFQPACAPNPANTPVARVPCSEVRPKLECIC